MSGDIQIETRSLLNHVASNETFMGKASRGQILIRLLKHYAQKGDMPLETLASSKYLGRALSTLKQKCRENDLKFPDYVPRHLKEKKEKAKK